MPLPRPLEEKIQSAVDYQVLLSVDERIALKTYLRYPDRLVMTPSELMEDDRCGGRLGHRKKIHDHSAFHQLLRRIDEFNDLQYGTIDQHRRNEKRRRGRRTDTDPGADAQIASTWATKRYRTLDELARAIGSTRKAVADALDRHRKRAKPAPE